MPARAESPQRAFCPKCGQKYAVPVHELQRREGLRFRATCRACNTPFSVRWDGSTLRTEIEEARAETDDARDVLRHGVKVGKYEVEDALASGGSATVYRAFDSGANRTVALKVLHQAPDSDYGLRFRREVEVQGNLKHPNLMPIFDHGRVDGKPYYTMELLLKPMTFDTVIGLYRNGRLTFNPTLRKLNSVRALLHQILLPVTRAIAFANRHGIIHRDLKPGNVIVDAKSLRVYVIDFGICHLFKTTGSRIMLRAGETKEAEEQRRLAMGTVRCMPPEQARGEVSEQGDVWALGALLRYVLTGDFPIAPALDLDRVGLTRRIANLEKIAASSRAAGDEAEASFYEGRVEELRTGEHRTIKELLRDAQRAAYVPLPDGVEPALAAIVARAMRADPDERYADAGAFGDDVQAWLDGRPVRAYAEHLGGPKAALYKTRLFGRRNRGIVVTAAVALTLAALGGGLYLFLAAAAETRRADLLWVEARQAENPAVQERKLAELLAIRPGRKEAEELLANTRLFKPLREEVARARTLNAKLVEARLEGERISDEDVREAEEVAAVLRGSTIPGLNALPEGYRGKKLSAEAETLERRLRGVVMVTLQNLPRGVEVLLVTSRARDTRELAWDRARSLGRAPLQVSDITVEPGSYVLVIRHVESGKALYVPFAISHQTRSRNTIDCPLDPATLPEGMVYVAGVRRMVYGDLRFRDATERVEIEPFFLDREEVTNAQYERYVDSLSPALRPRAVPRRVLDQESGQTQPLWTELDDGRWACPDGAEQLPVTGISLLDARNYARWAGKRLPTPQEWERAARGVDRRDYPFGMRLDPEAGNLATGAPAGVGSFSRDRSPFGVLDLAGNVAEWTTDRGSGTMATVKGGSFELPRYRAMATAFGRRPADRPYRDVGFRCAK